MKTVKQAGFVSDLPEKPGFNNLSEMLDQQQQKTNAWNLKTEETRIAALKTLMNYLGWQGGTVHDAVREAQVSSKPKTPEVEAALQVCQTYCDPRAVQRSSNTASIKTAQVTLTVEQFRELRIQIGRVMMNEIGLDMGEVVSLKPLTPDLPALGQPFSASYRTGGLAEHNGDVDGLLSDIGQLVGKSAPVQTSFGVVNVTINGRSIDKVVRDDTFHESDDEFDVNVKFTINAIANQQAPLSASEQGRMKKFSNPNPQRS